MPPADAPTPIQACLDRLASGDPTATTYVDSDPLDLSGMSPQPD